MFEGFCRCEHKRELAPVAVVERLVNFELRLEVQPLMPLLGRFFRESATPNSLTPKPALTQSCTRPEVMAKCI